VSLVLLMASNLSAASKSDEVPDRELLRIIELLREMEVIQRLDMLQQMDYLDSGAARSKQNPPRKTAPKKNQEAPK
jgi:hypothetical protein